jgi:hypothetical protein
MRSRSGATRRRALEAEALDGLHGAVGGHPRHDLRVGEVLRGPRTSQIPSSGSAHTAATRPTSARSSAHASTTRRGPPARAWCSASTTSPYTSSWNCWCAALPTRTGRESA